MTNISKHKAAATLGHMNVWHELRHKLKGDCFYFFRNCTLKPPRSFVRHSQQIFVFNFSVFRLYRCFQEGFLKTGEQLRHSSTAPSERRRQRGDGGTGWSDIWTAPRRSAAGRPRLGPSSSVRTSQERFHTTPPLLRHRHSPNICILILINLKTVHHLSGFYKTQLYVDSLDIWKIHTGCKNGSESVWVWIEKK